MDANQIETKAKGFRPFLRNCWTTRGLLIIGAILFIIGFCLLYVAPSSAVPVKVIRHVSVPIILFCTARLALKVAVAFFVSFRQKVFCACVPNSLLNKVHQPVRLAGFLLLSTGVLFIGACALFLQQESLPGLFLVFISFVWFVYAIWWRLSVPWRGRLEILVFGDKYRPIGLPGIIFLLLITLFVIIPTILLRDYNMRQRYVQEGGAAIGDLRLKIELFRHEYGKLPGLSKTTGITGEFEQASNARPFMQTAIQTYCFDESNQQQRVYLPALWDIAKGRPVPIGDLSNHYSSLLGIKVSDLNGCIFLRPNHVFYRATASEIHPGNYMHAVGIFGDGLGYKAGTGYAVLELCNLAVQTKRIAVWERFKKRPWTSDARQIVFASAAEHPFDAANIRDQNICWMGDPEALMSDDPVVFQRALDDLRSAGWMF